MIMKDNAVFLKKSLPALESLRKNVPSELVIVDTGSTDASKDIALKYTPNVFDFTWINDFAAARNFGIAKCRGNWVLVLDTDEVFADTAELEEFFNDDRKNGFCNSASYIQRNLYSATITDSDEVIEKDSYNDFDVLRCFRRVQNGVPVMYRGAIHEYIPEEYVYPIYQSKNYVNHFGYSYLTEKHQKIKNERNTRALLIEEEKSPDDSRIAKLLMQEKFEGKYEKSRVMLGRLCGIGKPYGLKHFYQPLFCTIIAYYREANLYKEAVAASSEYFKQYGKNNSIALNVLVSCVMSRYYLGDFVGAYEDLQDAFRLYEDKKSGTLDESLLMHTQNVYTSTNFENTLHAVAAQIMYNTGMFGETWDYCKKHIFTSDILKDMMSKIENLEASVQPLHKRFFLEETLRPYDGVQKNKILFPPLSEEEKQLAADCYIYSQPVIK